MKKIIQLLALALAGCVTLTSCSAVDALKNFWEFHQNFQPGKQPEEESTLGEDEQNVITEEQKKERELFETILDELFIEYLQEDAFSANYMLQNPDDYGLVFEEDDYVLGNYEEIEEEALWEEWDEYEETILELKKLEKELLTRQQQILYDKIIYNWEFDEKYAEVIDYSSYIGGENGIVFSLACNFYEYPFGDAQDIEHYLQFLKDIPNYIDYAIEQTEIQIAEGFVPSKYMLEMNCSKIDEICSEETNLFLDGFEQKVEQATFLEEHEKQKFLKENETIIKKQINPAFAKLREKMCEWNEEEAEYEGLYAMEGGQAYYEYLVAYYTGSDMSVNEMYRYLTKKLETYENAFYNLLKSNGSVYECLMNGEYGLTLTEPQAILDSLIAYTTQSFPKIEDPGYIIDWLPQSLESQGLLAYYVTPQLDVKRKNIIRLNGGNLETDLSQFYTTLAHEGYPGHLYATNYMQQQNWHPYNQLLTYMGYTEGWAEYAGLRSLYYWEEISKDLADALIYNEEMGYILQAITDIGINYKGWTLDNMYDVWSNYYEIEDKSELQDVYEYFKSEPATILSYPMGYLQIMDIRSSVKIVLGNLFSDTEFAKQFLNMGGAPFAIVEDYILDWAIQKANKANGISVESTEASTNTEK